MMNRLWGLIVLGVAVLAGWGCSCDPTTFDVRVSITPDLSRELDVGPVEVDLVGISSSDEAMWNGKRVSEYFSGSDRDRSAAIKTTMVFSRTDSSSKSLSRNDPIWKEWKAKGVSRLLVLADIPSLAASDSEGVRDPRRRILPLESCRWDGRAMEFEVASNGLRTVINPKPESN